MSERIKGSCLCGGVEFNTGPMDHMDVCHCTTCQRWTGSSFVGADYKSGDVVFTKDGTLKWFESSDWAKRGFCGTCGSSLFYRLKADPDFWAICSGALDVPEGIEIGKEIFVDEKPYFYAFEGDRPRLTGPEFLASLQGDSDDA